MASDEMKVCSNCGERASKRCRGCMGAPEYQHGDAFETFYCNRDCQRQHRPTHRDRCHLLKKRIALFRMVSLGKATAAAYHECLFPSRVIMDANMRDGALYIQYHPYGSTRFVPYPEYLPSDPIIKEALLFHNRCMAVASLFAPLASHFFPVIEPTITHTINVHVKATIPFKTNFQDDWEPWHTILKVQLGEEIWILDISAPQYGFRDIMEPYHKYEEYKIYYKEGEIGPTDVYDMTTAAGDLELLFSCEPILRYSPRGVLDRADLKARHAYATFVKNYFQDISAKDFLSGKEKEFQSKVDRFASEIKTTMTAFRETIW